ncbi:MAG: NADH-quinone oxidoreductase subunit F, partial [Desulfobacterales bacterium]|nr:NADH-quinone oxidoreductase subunit F [Desulfobacterales bacterium]
MNYSQIKEEAKQHQREKLDNGVIKVFVGCATCGISVGALEVVEAFRNELKRYEIQGDIIKVGCLGICFAEPLVYIMKNGNPTICYKNLKPEDVSRIVYNYFIEDDPCLDLAIGTLEIKEGNIPYIPELERFEKEDRIILRYAGAIDPEEIRDYIAMGGYEALDKALTLSREEIIEEVKKSG